MTNTRFTHSPTPWEDVLNIRTRLTEFMSGHRLAHTLSVEKEALDMAKIIFCKLNISQEYYSDISCAALLHDLTKHLTIDGHLDLCKKYSISVCDKFEKSPSILHSKTASYLAKELFNINDVVFNAIYCHTVGSSNMDLISKIIFLADYIEPTRNAVSCKNVRNMFYSSVNDGDSDILTVLDNCIVACIDNTLLYLTTQKSPIHIQTVITRNSILAESALQQSVEGLKK